MGNHHEARSESLHDGYAEMLVPLNKGVRGIRVRKLCAVRHHSVNPDERVLRVRI